MWEVIMLTMGEWQTDENLPAVQHIVLVSNRFQEPWIKVGYMSLNSINNQTVETP